MFTDLNVLDKYIHERVDIFQVAKYLDLKQHGDKSASSFFCPYHDDKSASFVAKQGWKTWSCLSGCGTGNMFHLVMKCKNLSYLEAVKDVAINLAGINEEDYQINDKNKVIEKFLKPLKKEQQEYLNNRGIKDETIKEFNLKCFTDKKNVDFISFPETVNNQITCYKFKNHRLKPHQKFEGNNTSICIYPNNNYKDIEYLWVVGGEWDCMILHQEMKGNQDFKNHKVVTNSTGEGSFPDNFIYQLLHSKALREVRILYDNDEGGRKGRERLANALVLANLKADVYIYSFDETKQKGYDVNDFFNEGYKIDDLLQIKKMKYETRHSEKVSYSDEELEKMILSYILFYNYFYNDIQKELRLKDFKDWKAQDLYKDIAFCIENYKYADFGLLETRFKDNIDMLNYLNSVMDIRLIGTTEEAFEVINKIHNSSYIKNYQKMLNVLKMNLEKFKTAKDLHIQLESLSENLLLDLDFNDDVKTMEQAKEEFWQDFVSKDVKYIVPTPFESINDALNGGLLKDEIHVLTAPVSFGKTIFARMFGEAGVKNGYKSIIYMLESSPKETAMNAISSITEINNKYFKRRELPSSCELNDTKNKARKDYDKLLFLKNGFSFNSFDEIIQDLRYRIKKDNIEFVIFDQLSSLPTEGKKTRKEFLDECLKKMYRLVKQEHICLLINTQMKQESQKMKGKNETLLVTNKKNQPDLTDIADTAEIARIAYTVMFASGKDRTDREATVYFEKNRNGEAGVSVKLFAEREYSRFIDWNTGFTQFTKKGDTNE